VGNWDNQEKLTVMAVRLALEQKMTNLKMMEEYSCQTTTGLSSEEGIPWAEKVSGAVDE
jgi:hypothetical protein